MADFLSILALYDAWDAAARVEASSREEAMQCMAYYDRVKVHFMSSEDQRPASSREAFLAFKAWERDHPGVVARLRGSSTNYADLGG
ncbi:hypothetical protein [Roseobacter sinensis]|uniref:Uncharacterized protein n=1 Tax=Roseobacter sinensis TaxID=2931391 RepID=A0ABT3BA38_9RHOB|nr:hypothetical protein [Roseobacter sp. WL0113]MCV3270441.1 hypothetical protein [Roseobacter sp. WL0113]